MPWLQILVICNVEVVFVYFCVTKQIVFFQPPPFQIFNSKINTGLLIADLSKISSSILSCNTFVKGGKFGYVSTTKTAGYPIQCLFKKVKVIGLDNLFIATCSIEGFGICQDYNGNLSLYLALRMLSLDLLQLRLLNDLYGILSMSLWV